MFKTYQGFNKVCFARRLGILFAFEAELLVVIAALDYAKGFGRDNLWFESDSANVVDLLKNKNVEIP